MPRKTFSAIPKEDNEGKFTNEFRKGLLKSRLDITRGNFVTHENLKKKLKL